MADAKSSEFRTALITVVVGIISATGTIGVAYLGGFFNVANTDAASRGTIEQAKLNFSNDLVKTALSSDNPANSLLFYADVGLLAGLNAKNVKEYAERETKRLEQGGNGPSLLPSFDKSARPKLWLDRDFFASFAPKAKPEIVDVLVSTGNYVLTGFGIESSPSRLSMFLGEIAHETGGLSRFDEENSNYSKERLVVVFPQYLDEEMAAEYAKQPQRILNLVYANRLGNGPETSGDGWRFRKRGFLWLAGRDNYQKLSNETGIDLDARFSQIEG